MLRTVDISIGFLLRSMAQKRKTNLLYFSTKAGSFYFKPACCYSVELVRTDLLPLTTTYLVLLSKLGKSSSQDEHFLFVIRMQLFLQFRVYPGRFGSSDLRKGAVCESEMIASEMNRSARIRPLSSRVRVDVRNTIVFSVRVATHTHPCQLANNVIPPPSLSQSRLTILVLLYQRLGIIVKRITRRILCSNNISSDEIVVPYVDHLDLLRIGLFDLFGELGGGDVLVGWVEGHNGGPLVALKHTSEWLAE
jgi:hypothetical protein